MASSEAGRPRTSRRMIWLAAFILVLFGGYTIGWFYVGNLLTSEVKRFVSSANASGMNVECGGARASGFPFRMGLFCNDVHYENPGEFALSAAAFRSAAQVYNPFLIVTELDSPARAEARGAALDMDWTNLRASLRYNLDNPERISVEVRDVKTALAVSGNATPLISAASAQAHARPNGVDLDVAASFVDLLVDPSVLNGGTLPPFSGSSDISIANGVSRLVAGGDLVLGQSGTIHEMSISTGDASLSVTGTFAVAMDGLIDADLTVKAKNPEAFGKIAAAAFPDSADQINSSFSGLAALGENAELPLTIDRGKVTFGFLPLGTLPPLLPR